MDMGLFYSGEPALPRTVWPEPLAKPRGHQVEIAGHEVRRHVDLRGLGERFLPAAGLRAAEGMVRASLAVAKPGRTDAK
jgi:hypothetical protein